MQPTSRRRLLRSGALAFAAPCAFPLLPGYVASFVGANGNGGGVESDQSLSTDEGGGRSTTTAATDGGPGTARAAETTAESMRPSLGRAVFVAGVTGLGATLVFAAFALVVAAFGAAVAALAAEFELVAAAVVGTYALGLVLALGAVTVAAALGHTALVDRLRAGTDRITRIAGVLLVVAGLAQIHYAVTVANALG